MGASAPLRVVVLKGGDSSEREVSLASAAQVEAALREAGHEVTALDVSDRTLPGIVTTHPAVGAADVVFPVLHGGSGEDGTVQALLALAGVAWVGSDRIGCTLSMDKEISKRLFRDAGIPTPDWIVAEADARGTVPAEVLDQVESRLGLPVIVKPPSGGSTVGLTLAHDRAELEAAVPRSAAQEPRILFERYVKGREFTVGVVEGAGRAAGDPGAERSGGGEVGWVEGPEGGVGAPERGAVGAEQGAAGAGRGAVGAGHGTAGAEHGAARAEQGTAAADQGTAGAEQGTAGEGWPAPEPRAPVAFPVGEVRPAHELFDYACKYEPGLAEEIFPADLEPALAAEAQALALRVHALLRLRHLSRIDFLLDAEGGLWCLEANALPGMTGNSLLPRAARAHGWNFARLCDHLVRLAAASGTPPDSPG